MATQEEIDQLTKDLEEAKAAITTEITALEAKIAAGEGNNLDLTALKAAVGDITSIETPAPTPQPNAQTQQAQEKDEDAARDSV